MDKLKILSVSHFDLDGFGCQLCINEKFKKHEIIYANCGYSKIEKTLDYNFNDFNLIFITDLNFNINQQKFLYEKLKDYKGKCIYVDHHQYDEGYEILKKANCKVIIDDSKSATLLTYETLKLNNPKLRKICELIDVFDMWRVKDKRFKAASYFNSWFWENVEIFRPKLKMNNYDLSFIKEELKQLHQKIKKYFEENKNLYFFDENTKILIAFSYEYMNHLEEFFPDFKFAIITNREAGLSIRDYYNLKKEMQKIAKKYNGDCGGHIEAYGMSIPNLKDNYKNIIKDIVEEVKNNLSS